MTDAIGQTSGRTVRNTLPKRGKIVIADDDVGLRRMLRDLLGFYDFDIQEADDDLSLNTILSEGPIDLLVIDAALPGEGGLSVCQRLAAVGGPGIIIISALAGAAARVEGLETGADDYLSKPCNPRELLARIRAVLRRRPDATPATPVATEREFDGWKLDLVRRKLVSPAQRLISLSDTEFNLLRGLLDQPQRILSRAQLLAMASGADSDNSDKGVDVQVSRLRRKFDDGSGRKFIRTVRNEGYMFTARAVR